MALTASFSEVRQNLTSITNLVATEGVEVTVLKRSKPICRIVPVEEAGERDGSSEAMVDWRSAPEGGAEGGGDRSSLYEEAMALRDRARPAPELAQMSVDDMKEALADRV